jgi:hypothetical protein
MWSHPVVWSRRVASVVIGVNRHADAKHDQSTARDVEQSVHVH